MRSNWRLPLAVLLCTVGALAEFELQKSSSYYKIAFYGDAGCSTRLRTVFIMNGACSLLDKTYKVLIDDSTTAPTYKECAATSNRRTGTATSTAECFGTSTPTCSFNQQLPLGSCVSAASSALSGAPYTKFLGGLCASNGCGFGSLKLLASMDYDQMTSYTPAGPAVQTGYIPGCLNAVGAAMLEFEVPADTCVQNSFTEAIVNGGAASYYKYSCANGAVTSVDYGTDSSCSASSLVSSTDIKIDDCVGLAGGVGSLLNVGCGEHPFSIPGTGTMSETSHTAYIWGCIFPSCLVAFSAALYVTWKRFIVRHEEDAQLIQDGLGESSRALFQQVAARQGPPERSLIY